MKLVCKFFPAEKKRENQVRSLAGRLLVRRLRVEESEKGFASPVSDICKKKCWWKLALTAGVEDKVFVSSFLSQVCDDDNCWKAFV